MRAFLSMKYWGDQRNRTAILTILTILKELGCVPFSVAEHAEVWGKRAYGPGELMRLTFREIDASDALVANVAHWPIGIGVEVGYAYARGIPIVCICPRGERVADTVAGIATHVIEYDDVGGLAHELGRVLPLLSLE